MQFFVLFLEFTDGLALNLRLTNDVTASFFCQQFMGCLPLRHTVGILTATLVVNVIFLQRQNADKLTNDVILFSQQIIASDKSILTATLANVVTS